MNTDQIICIPWWQPEQWDKLKSISEDGENLEESYEEWRANANNVISEFKAKSFVVKKVKVDLEELHSWCKENGRIVNGSARSEFVAKLQNNRDRRKP